MERWIIFGAIVRYRMMRLFRFASGGIKNGLKAREIKVWRHYGNKGFVDFFTYI